MLKEEWRRGVWAAEENLAATFRVFFSRWYLGYHVIGASLCVPALAGHDVAEHRPSTQACRASKAIPVHQAESQCCDAARGGPLWVCCTWGTRSAPPAILQDTCKEEETHAKRK